MVQYKGAAITGHANCWLALLTWWFSDFVLSVQNSWNLKFKCIYFFIVTSNKWMFLSNSSLKGLVLRNIHVIKITPLGIWLLCKKLCILSCVYFPAFPLTHQHWLKGKIHEGSAPLWAVEAHKFIHLVQQMYNIHINRLPDWLFSLSELRV